MYFDNESEQLDSIQRDLERDVFGISPAETIYVMHCPPWGTSLDKTTAGLHVGSFAELLFIQQHQPFMTLHGHIHECVEQSGEFTEVIGNTVSMAVGNDHLSQTLHMLEIDPGVPMSAQRVSLACTGLLEQGDEH